MSEDKNAPLWRIAHYAVGAVWAAIGLWGIVGLLAFGTDAIISSLPLIFVASMWANMMMHFQKAQQHNIERKADNNNGSS